MENVVWKEVCFECGLYGACSRSVASVCMALEMSIVDMCLVRIMCGVM